mmetsp:Transcript_6201/g.18594  ORF Transcript_6201/g.18594 Transcript_6201/m.18594 type:complete len:344 (+) Transcript_6201:113-1144(+)
MRVAALPVNPAPGLSAMVPPPASRQYGAPPAAGIGFRSQAAAMQALQKFSMFEAERAMAETQAVAAEVFGAAHVAASAKAEATAARLQSAGPRAFEIAPLLGGGQEAQEGAAGSSSNGASAASGSAAANAAAQTDASPSGGGGVRSAGATLPGTGQGGSSGGKRYVGKVKAFNPSHGFGFITCAEILRTFGCDAYLSHAVEGGLIIGSTVSFGIELNKDGKPQARHVVLVDAGPVKSQKTSSAVAGRSYLGRVKSFNVGRGFGFLTCPEVLDVFGGRDIYVSKQHAPDGQLTPGQEVQFRLYIDRFGQPQGRDIVKMAPKQPVAPMPALASHSEAPTGLRLFG